MIHLSAGATTLSLDLARGGGVRAFDWRGHAVFAARPADAGPFGLGNFVLLPFAGRIAQARLVADGVAVQLARNFPGRSDYPHAIHGVGWQAAWRVDVVDAAHLQLSHAHDPAGQDAAWPWAYTAQQCVTVRDDGYDHALTLTNCAARPMPAGLGLHPYFPRAGARLTLGVDGYWATGPDDLPTAWCALGAAPDWFGAAGLEGAMIDHSFTGRQGAVHIDWPTHRLVMAASDALAFTHVYVPRGLDYFCVEPVSHRPDAVNAGDDVGQSRGSGLRWLAPGESWAVSVGFTLTAV